MPWALRCPNGAHCLSSPAPSWMIARPSKQLASVSSVWISSAGARRTLSVLRTSPVPGALAAPKAAITNASGKESQSGMRPASGVRSGVHRPCGNQLVS